MGAVSSVVHAVGDVVGGAVDAVKDVGSFIDDAVNDVVPAGWAGVAAIAAPFVAPEILGAEAATDYLGSAALGDATTGAVGSGATGIGLTGSSLGADAIGAGIGAGLGGSALAETAAAPVFTGWNWNNIDWSNLGNYDPTTNSWSGFNAPSTTVASAPTTDYLGSTALGEVAPAYTPSQLAEALTTPTTDYLGSTALGDATTGAVGQGTTGFGLSTTPVATGIDASVLGETPWLGGSTTLPEGTAGLTADQIANSAIGNVGTNASSGLGYLGGSESLPAGTAGISGVDTSSLLSNLSDLTKALGQGLTSGNTSSLFARGLTGGLESAPIGYNLNKNPFAYPTQQPIQGGNTFSTVPQELQQQNLLAGLLRKQ